MPKHWKSKEIEAVCKGYVKATLNTRIGADMDLKTFASEVANRMMEFSPADPELGTWHLRRGTVYTHLRDRVFPSIQKYIKCLRHIYSCNPTGCTEQEKWNMAVAMHVGKTRTMNYDFKGFDPESWKSYKGWLVLKHLPKFSYEHNGETNVSTSTPVSTSDAPGSDDSGPRSSTGIRARGTRRGRDDAKARESREKLKQQKQEKREKQFEQVTKSLADITAEIKSKTRASVLRQALKVAQDDETKKKLEAKLIELALQI